MRKGYRGAGLDAKGSLRRRGSRRALQPRVDRGRAGFLRGVANNESAVTETGTGVLADIARVLVRSLRRDVTTDWVSPG
jgi:hypothetical protein